MFKESIRKNKNTNRMILSKTPKTIVTHFLERIEKIIPAIAKVANVIKKKPGYLE